MSDLNWTPRRPDTELVLLSSDQQFEVNQGVGITTIVLAKQCAVFTRSHNDVGRLMVNHRVTTVLQVSAHALGQLFQNSSCFFVGHLLKSLVCRDAFDPLID